MVLRVPISDEVAARLRAKAAFAGVEVEAYVAAQLERLTSPPLSLAQLSGPIAEAFAQSGMTEDQLSDLLEAEKHEMRAERRGQTKS
jgi:hypothetical protein